MRKAAKEPCFAWFSFAELFTLIINSQFKAIFGRNLVFLSKKWGSWCQMYWFYERSVTFTFFIGISKTPQNILAISVLKIQSQDSALNTTS
jgi:hypothetical protein